jgi:UDP-2-acetamido-3-amino-2,3-dideoxy-glucuronate N-acetyltransferase
VTRDVADFALYGGVPGKQLGWMSAYGERIALPVQGDGEAMCEHTGDRYFLTKGVMSRVASD